MAIDRRAMIVKSTWLYRTVSSIDYEYTCVLSSYIINANIEYRVFCKLGQDPLHSTPYVHTSYVVELFAFDSLGSLNSTPIHPGKGNTVVKGSIDVSHLLALSCGDQK